MLYIGIDLGTSAVKLLLMDEEGQIQNIVSREYPLSFPKPGWSEQNPADWLEAVVTGIRELTADCDKTRIAAIGCGGQMHGLVALDENDAVIRPAILWNDGRTQKQVEYLNEAIGREKLSRYTANIAFAGFTAPKLLWMRENEPENFARIRKIMLPKDYINYKLTGIHCTDYSDASGMLLLDVAHKRWSAEMCQICGVTEEQLPELYESWEIVGALTPDAAQALGLPTSVKVCAGAGDNAAAAIGTGAVGAGGCNISLGTSGTIFISAERFGVDPTNALHAFAHADGGWHLMGCMLSAASCNQWWCGDILGTKDYPAEQKAITPDKLGRNPVFFLADVGIAHCPAVGTAQHQPGGIAHDPARVGVHVDDIHGAQGEQAVGGGQVQIVQAYAGVHALGIHHALVLAGINHPQVFSGHAPGHALAGYRPGGGAVLELSRLLVHPGHTAHAVVPGHRAGKGAVRDQPAVASGNKGLLLALYLAGAALVWLFRAHLFSLDTYGMFSPVLEAVINLLIPLMGWAASWRCWGCWERPGTAGRQRRACRKRASPTMRGRPLS